MAKNIGLEMNLLAGPSAIQPVKNYAAFCKTDSRFHGPQMHLTGCRIFSLSVLLALALALVALALALFALALALFALALVLFSFD